LACDAPTISVPPAVSELLAAKVSVAAEATSVDTVAPVTPVA
jgi:hypothetical protein